MTARLAVQLCVRSMFAILVGIYIWYNVNAGIVFFHSFGLGDTGEMLSHAVVVSQYPYAVFSPISRLALAFSETGHLIAASAVIPFRPGGLEALVLAGGGSWSPYYVDLFSWGLALFSMLYLLYLRDFAKIRNRRLTPRQLRGRIIGLGGLICASAGLAIGVTVMGRTGSMGSPLYEVLAASELILSGLAIALLSWVLALAFQGVKVARDAPLFGWLPRRAHLASTHQVRSRQRGSPARRSGVVDRSEHRVGPAKLALSPHAASGELEPRERVSRKRAQPGWVPAQSNQRPRLAVSTSRLGTLLVRLPGGELLRLPLFKGRFCLGRAPDNEWVIPERHISRYHVRLLVTEHGVQLENLATSKSTRLRGQPIATSAVVSWSSQTPLRLSGGTILELELN